MSWTFPPHQDDESSIRIEQYATQDIGESIAAKIATLNLEHLRLLRWRNSPSSASILLSHLKAMPHLETLTLEEFTVDIIPEALCTPFTPLESTVAISCLLPMLQEVRLIHITLRHGDQDLPARSTEHFLGRLAQCLVFRREQNLPIRMLTVVKKLPLAEEDAALLRSCVERFECRAEDQIFDELFQTSTLVDYENDWVRWTS